MSSKKYNSPQIWMMNKHLSPLCAVNLSDPLNTDGVLQVLIARTGEKHVIRFA